MSGFSSLRKTTVASKRLSSSGRNVRFASARSFSLSSSWLVAAFLVAKPSVRPSFAKSKPKLAVQMIIVLRKSIVRPCPSVRRPSSRICRSILQTS